MDILTDVILAGFTWDIIKKLLSKGVIVVSRFSSMLFENLKYATDIETCEKIAFKTQPHCLSAHSFEEYVKALQNDKEYMDCIKSNVNYKTEFAKRLDYFISLTNAYSNQKINLEKIAVYIGLKSAYELRKFYIEDRDPDFDFIEVVAEKLGINQEWLKNGLGNMIIPKYKSYFATECYDNIKEDNPQQIFFCISDESHMGIVCQIDDLRFNICNYTWHFNKDVGGTGMHQIEEIYHFICSLDRDDLLSKCEVLFFPTESFYNIFECNLPPSSVCFLGKRKFISQYWLEDFISLKPTNEYGDSFKFCQDVVRARIQD